MLEGKNAYARASLIPQVILLHEKEIRLLASVLHALTWTDSSWSTSFLLCMIIHQSDLGLT